MSPRRRNILQPLTAGQLLFGDWPTVDVSGDSGTGKSCLLQQLILAGMRSGSGGLVIDPAGDLVDDVEACLPSLPRSLRQRVIVVRAADPRHIVPINPLRIVGGSVDSVLERAWWAVKIEHVTMLLLAAWGELDQGVQGRPRLWKHVYLWLSTLAACLLAIPDVVHFFHLRSKVYRALAARAPDLFARVDLAALAEMKPADAEELIASAKTRFLALLNNPYVVAALGGGVASIPAFDAYRAIQEGRFVLVHLGRGDDVLRDMDVQILANLWLSEFLFAAYSTPRRLRRPFLIVLDELQEFESSAPLLTRLARFGRKYLIRGVCAHQGTQFFGERTDSRLLNALVGQSGVRVLFRHTNPADRRYYAEVLARPNPWAVKHVLTQDQQYQDGHSLTTLIDRSESWNDARQEGTSDAAGSSQQHTDTDGGSVARQILAHGAGSAERNVNATTHSAARGHGANQTHTVTESLTRSRGGSRTFRQVLLPRMRNRKIVTSVQFLNHDEQLGQHENELAELAVGEAQVHFSGQRPRRVRFQLLKRPYAGTPRFAARKLAAVRTEYLAANHYRSAAEILAIREQFTQRFAEAALASPAQSRPAPSQSVPRLPRQSAAPPRSVVARPSESATSPFGEGF